MFTNMIPGDLREFASADTIKTHRNDDVKTGSACRGASIVNTVAAQENGTFKYVPVAGLVVIADFTIIGDIIRYWCIRSAAPQTATRR